jgi:hypothetical protein
MQPGERCVESLEEAFYVRQVRQLPLSLKRQCHVTACEVEAHCYSR